MREPSVQTNDGESIAESIRLDLTGAYYAFHTLLDTFTEEDFRQPSRNPGWTNGEILAHMVFGFIILNALLPLAKFWGRFPRWASKPFSGVLNASTRPFNWFNALGARMQAKVFTCQRIGRLFDRIYLALLDKVDTIKDHEWARGMAYPTRWDPNFDEFMTLEKLFRYSVTHFNFHRTQLAFRDRDLG